MNWLAFRRSGEIKWRVLYVATVFDTPGAREEGLRGHVSLPVNRAAVFSFDNERRQAMTMVGVRFPLDFVYLDRLGYVIGVHANAAPGTRHVIATPGTRTVVELAAGAIPRDGITEGMRAEFYST